VAREFPASSNFEISSSKLATAHALYGPPARQEDARSGWPDER